MPNAFQNAMKQIERAHAARPFEEEFLKRVTTPDRVLEKTLEIEMDDGSARSFEAYRVQFNAARGPYKGGIRFHPQTDLDEVKALAFWMALKTAVMQLPMGGGKGGITVDPKGLSDGELERLSRAWVRAFAADIGPEKDVPAPDVGTDPRIMDWMADEFARITGDTSGAVVTGKSLAHGGSEGRAQATAQGGFFVFEALKGYLGLPEICRVAIQGFGNAGSVAAELWSAAGHKVVAVSDSRTGIYAPEGLDIAAVIAHKQANRTLAGFPGAKEVTNAELLALECDLLIPAALENVLTAENADAVQAKAVLELANGPTTTEADDILNGKGISVVPDILANAGGVTVSTFEWEQNKKGEHWSAEEVGLKLHRVMDHEARNVYQRSIMYETDLRRAAFILALERLLLAM